MASSKIQAALRDDAAPLTRWRTDHARKIEQVALTDLKVTGARARTHSDAQIAMIMGSFTAFGMINPLIADQDGNILAGAARYEAARRLGRETVPVVQVDHLSAEERRAYIIADNRIAEKAGWDLSVLAPELEFLSSIDLRFEVDVTGFSIGEIDVVIDEHQRQSNLKDEDEGVLPEVGPAVTRPGDVWAIGGHRLACASALEAASYETVLSGKEPRLVLTDPPYNIAISGFARAANAHREFAMASGEMSEVAFIAFLTTALTLACANLVPGGLAYVFMDHRHVYELIAAARASALTQMNICVWDKINAGMGSFYRSRHEFCCVFKKGREPHLNTIELGRHGRDRSNVWSHRGLSGFGRGRDADLAAHPTVKPWPLLADAIKDCTRRRDVVLDPFAGSGSTLIAAAKTGRVGYGIELDPAYVDVALKRLARCTGQTPILVATGQSFAEVEARRRNEAVEQPLILIRKRSRTLKAEEVGHV